MKKKPPVLTRHTNKKGKTAMGKMLRASNKKIGVKQNAGRKK